MYDDRFVLLFWVKRRGKSGHAHSDMEQGSG